jgi:3-hydroxy acid dehydrogenase / malonic semialdehyde reductase
MAEIQTLRGRVAFITGASSGIGASIARALSTEGVSVALAARRTERVQQIADDINSAGGNALTLTCDVRDEEQVKAAVTSATSHFGGLDILIANAGFGYRSPIIDGDTDRWKAMIDTNIFGMLLTLKYGVPPLIERGHGDVILLSSVAGHVVGNGGAAYSATKFAVNAIGEALRQEVARKNVRVTLLAPGVVISEFQEVAGYAPNLIDNWLAGTPPIQTDEIAQAILSILALPPHVSVNQMIVRPTGQVNP